MVVYPTSCWLVPVNRPYFDDFRYVMSCQYQRVISHSHEVEDSKRFQSSNLWGSNISMTISLMVIFHSYGTVYQRVGDDCISHIVGSKLRVFVFFPRFWNRNDGPEQQGTGMTTVLSLIWVLRWSWNDWKNMGLFEHRVPASLIV